MTERCSNNACLMKPTCSPCVGIVMFTCLLLVAVFMNEFSITRNIQAHTSPREYDIILLTSAMQSVTVTFYFVMGTLWGYLVGELYRKHELANQAGTRANYGTMASEA